mgnify:CR=1 FL=1
MSQYYKLQEEFFVDMQRCIGCKSCEAACAECETNGEEPMIHVTALVNMQVDALKHLQGAEALGYTFYIYHFLTQNYFAGKIKQNIWKCLILRDKKK